MEKRFHKKVSLKNKVRKIIQDKQTTHSLDRRNADGDVQVECVRQENFSDSQKDMVKAWNERKTEPTFNCPTSKVKFIGKCPITECPANISNNNNSSSGCIYINLGRFNINLIDLSYVFKLSKSSIAKEIEKSKIRLKIIAELYKINYAENKIHITKRKRSKIRKIFKNVIKDNILLDKDWFKLDMFIYVIVNSDKIINNIGIEGLSIANILHCNENIIAETRKILQEN